VSLTPNGAGMIRPARKDVKRNLIWGLKIAGVIEFRENERLCKGWGKRQKEKSKKKKARRKEQEETIRRK
jgi:hypothetical protein